MKKAAITRRMVDLILGIESMHPNVSDCSECGPVMSRALRALGNRRSTRESLEDALAELKTLHAQLLSEIF